MTTDRYQRHRQAGAVESALDILEAVARLGAGVTAKEIAEHLGMASATSYRLLNTLVASEHLVRVADLRGFALGHRTDGLVNAAAQPFIPGAAREVMAGLRQQVRFGVHLVVYLGNTLRVADADPDRPVRSEQDLQRHPHASAAGKLLLAQLPDWRAAVSRLTPVTPWTITDAQSLERALENIRRTGVAQQVGESHPDLACLAVPVCSKARTVVGAVCLAGPAARADALVQHVDQARAAARRLPSLIS
jgi:DNA-binding IclR family transcriptional regulator